MEKMMDERDKEGWKKGEKTLMSAKNEGRIDWLKIYIDDE